MAVEGGIEGNNGGSTRRRSGIELGSQNREVGPRKRNGLIKEVNPFPAVRNKVKAIQGAVEKGGRKGDVPLWNFSCGTI